VSLVDPSIGFLGIKAFAAAVVGGFGSLIGTVFGGLIVGVSETLPRWLSLRSSPQPSPFRLAPRMA
jgi:branched-chain amino acid transport system permease protein